MKVLFTLSVVLVMFVLSVSAQTDWAGFYEFSENGGKTSGGTAIIVNHELEVFNTDDGLKARIKTNGYQTSKDLTATVKIEGEKITFYLEGYGEDNVLETYKEGDLLFSLEYKKQILLSNWGKYLPVTEEKPKSGKVYFQKLTRLDN